MFAGGDIHLEKLKTLTTPCLAALAGILLAAVFCGREQPSRSGRDVDERLEKLRSVPYTSVTPEEVSPETSGVMILDEDRAWPGYNLYCSRVSPEAFLLDMDGDVVHVWSYEHGDCRIWDHAVMRDGGDLIVLNKFRYVFRLDWDSNLEWENRLEVHHDIAVAGDGSIFVVERSTETHRGLKVHFDNIVRLDPGGRVLERWSTREHLEDLKAVLDVSSFLDTTLDLKESMGVIADSAAAVGKPHMRRPGGRDFVYDYFHLNTITILPDNPIGRRDRRFAEGNLLVCFRNVNQLATIEPETGGVLWGWGEGVLEWPHHPTMLENGNILVFDNGVVRRHSTVLEIDPVSGSVMWEYKAEPPERFYTPQKGSAQRLPNGNTLICEGDRGRAFEVTRDGEIVWEWYNPITEEGKRVQVYRVMRYPVEMVAPLLGR